MKSIGVGSKTSTGGEVVEGNPGLMFNGREATSVGQKATCPKCKKGWGYIVAVGPRDVHLPAGPAARAGDYVECGCPEGDNVLLSEGDVYIGSATVGEKSLLLAKGAGSAESAQGAHEANDTSRGLNSNIERSIIHNYTGDNSPDYYDADGTPVWVVSAAKDEKHKNVAKSPTSLKEKPPKSKGYWREIGRVYGKGSSGTFIGSKKVKLKFFDEQGLAISNGVYFSIDYQQLGVDGKPIPTISSKSHGQLMKAVPLGLIYELHGGSVEKFSWHIETKVSAASCDSCGAGGIVVSEFVYE